MELAKAIKNTNKRFLGAFSMQLLVNASKNIRI